MTVSISSAQNPRIKEAVRLRDRRGRDRQERIRIDGAREVRRALDAGVPIVELFACVEWCESDDARYVLSRCEASEGGPYMRGSPPPPLFTVTPQVFEKLAFGERSDGLVAIASPPTPSLADWRLPTDPLIVVLDGLEKPGNVGAILRTCDGAGVDGVIVCDGGTDLYNPHVIRASLGVVFSQAVCAATRGEALAWLRGHQVRIVAARVEGAKRYSDVPLTGPLAIVLGAEDQGLAAEWSGPDVEPISLPMLGVADSLNVSAAAAVLCYESRRQRNAK